MPGDAATEARSASIRSITGVSLDRLLGLRQLAALGLRREQLAELGAVLAAQLGRVELALETADQLLGKRKLLLAYRRPCDGLVDLGLALHVLGDVERLERERVALRADQAELLLPGEHERADADDAGVPHRREQQRVRAALGLGAGRDEVVRAVEEDGVDLVGADEARDLDRARGVAALERLELVVLDRDELALHDLPAAHELVRPDLDVVDRAPALLLDRRQTLAMQHPELHVGLPSGRRRRRREPDGDADESEADRSVPGCAHRVRILGRTGSALDSRSRNRLLRRVTTT